MQNWIFLAFLLGSVSEHVWVRVPRNLSLETRVDMRFISASLSSHFSACHWPNFWAGGQKKLKKDVVDGTCEDTQIYHISCFFTAAVDIVHGKKGNTVVENPWKDLKRFWDSFPVLSCISSFVTWSRWKTWPPPRLLLIRQKAFQNIIIVSSTCVNNIISRRWVPKMVPKIQLKLHLVFIQKIEKWKV